MACKSEISSQLTITPLTLVSSFATRQSEDYKAHQTRKQVDSFTALLSIQN